MRDNDGMRAWEPAWGRALGVGAEGVAGLTEGASGSEVVSGVASGVLGISEGGIGAEMSHTEGQAHSQNEALVCLIWQDRKLDPLGKRMVSYSEILLIEGEDMLDNSSRTKRAVPQKSRFVSSIQRLVILVMAVILSMGPVMLVL